MKISTYSKQFIDKDDITSVIKTLKSDYLTSGPKVLEFEKKISSLVKSKYAVSANSATSALHLGCLALNIKKNDIVWTSANSFVASANCAIYCGAKIDLVDIDLNTFNISIENLKSKLKLAKQKNKLPKVLIVVHLGGLSCEMFEIHKLSKKYKFKIIEDASHALGSQYKNRPVGSCHYSEMCIFSFHPVKIITTCEGGVVTTNSKKIEDCWGCRIVGGGTLIGVSMYLWRSQQRGSVTDRRVTSALAIAAFTCGALRLSLSQDQLHRIWNRKYD